MKCDSNDWVLFHALLIFLSVCVLFYFFSFNVFNFLTFRKLTAKLTWNQRRSLQASNKIS